MSFPCGTGLGWDKIHPRALLRLSEAAVDDILAYIREAEGGAGWGACAGITLIVLLPKSDGGTRPIGLFPSLVRIWMRVRLPVAREWQDAHDRAFFYAGPAKGATVAAWMQGFPG